MPFEGQPSYSNASEENVVSQGDTEDDEVQVSICCCIVFSYSCSIPLPQGHAEHVADKGKLYIYSAHVKFIQHV